MPTFGTLILPYCSIIHCAFFLKFATDCFVIHSLFFPSLSYRRPSKIQVQYRGTQVMLKGKEIERKYGGLNVKIQSSIFYLRHRSRVKSRDLWLLLFHRSWVPWKRVSKCQNGSNWRNDHEHRHELGSQKRIEISFSPFSMLNFNITDLERQLQKSPTWRKSVLEKITIFIQTMKVSNGYIWII